MARGGGHGAGLGRVRNLLERFRNGSGESPRTFEARLRVRLRSACCFVAPPGRLSHRGTALLEHERRAIPGRIDPPLRLHSDRALAGKGKRRPFPSPFRPTNACRVGRRRPALPRGRREQLPTTLQSHLDSPIPQSTADDLGEPPRPRSPRLLRFGRSLEGPARAHPPSAASSRWGDGGTSRSRGGAIAKCRIAV